MSVPCHRQKENLFNNQLRKNVKEFPLFFLGLFVFDLIVGEPPTNWKIKQHESEIFREDKYLITNKLISIHSLL